MILYNKSKNLIVSSKLKIAESFIDRFLGLIPRKEIFDDECLIIKNCRGVHSCFMSFPIDVVFLDKDLKVIDVIGLKPWRFSKFYDSFYACEFKYNSVYGKISCGDILEIL